MSGFWEESWKTIDSGRIAAYVDGFSLESDSIIEYLHSCGVKMVCDAGCGCGIYGLKMAANGFEVSGFDVSVDAVEIAKNVVENAGFAAKWKVASVLSTGYAENCFDGVVSRDVLDHMGKEAGKLAVRELLRITCPGGCLVFTLDGLDEEYETEPHFVNSQGDFVFTGGKWEGMVFHPYTQAEVLELLPDGVNYEVEEKNGELTVKLRKTPGK